MPPKKLSRNAPCPCGSGKVYGACCWDKGFEWVEDEAGTAFRSTPMTPEVREALEQLRQAFIARHGREPGPDDLLFPDLFASGHGHKLGQWTEAQPGSPAPRLFPGPGNFPT
jgi:hypothetical protein